MILMLKLEDGSTEEINTDLPTRHVLRLIGKWPVETIIVSDIDDGGKVLWEKQFQAVDVMPSDFGKPRK